MATPLEKTLKRELSLDGLEFIVAISPDGIKLTLKGKRNGQELKWRDWVSGEAALAVALNASLGGFAKSAPPARATTPPAQQAAGDSDPPLEPRRPRKPVSKKSAQPPKVDAGRKRGTKARP